MASLRPFAILCVVMALGLALPVQAQNSGEAERKLQTIKRELQAVAAERRKIEGQRGSASKALREADEQVGRSNRTLREIESALAREQAALSELQDKRRSMQSQLGDQRTELTRLLRAAYTQGRAAPLKVLLAQDRVVDANRVLTYHRYLQQDRARRISALTAELAALDALEQEIGARQAELDGTRDRLQAQLDDLEGRRKARAQVVQQLDTRYQDRSAREKALGRDAKGLEQLLRKLRAAAARAEAQRKAAAEKAARLAGAGATGSAARAPAAAASAPALQVGGLGWPLTGALVTGYGGKLPDGRSSDGLLIGAGAGTAVKAVADGQVAYAEWMTGYGLLLIVDHGNGYMSLYAHNDALLKDPGDPVKRGDAVATVGSSGGHGRPALYFELRRNGQPVNPNVWLKK